MLPPVVRTLIYGFLDPVIRSSDLLNGKCAISPEKKVKKTFKEKKHRVISKSNFQQWRGDKQREKKLQKKVTIHSESLSGSKSKLDQVFH